jgi:hypothetical protein
MTVDFWDAVKAVALAGALRPARHVPTVNPLIALRYG